MATSNIRVLNTCSCLGYGGTEMRTIERVKQLRGHGISFDFCLLSERPDKPDVLAADARAMGCDVLHCPVGFPGVFSFRKRFKRLIRDRKYDVIHSYSHYTSGLILSAAAELGIPSRFCHFQSVGRKYYPPHRRLYNNLMMKLIPKYATKILSNCKCGMSSYWGKDWQQDPRAEVVYDGLDLEPYRNAPDRAGVLSGFGIPAESPVVIHVGNFSPAKGHDTIVKTAEIVAARIPRVKFLLVGHGGRGDVSDQIRKMVVDKGLQKVVIFAGRVPEVPPLLMASDCFIFPSRWEGLPGALLEALAAGLPAVASDIEANREVAETTDRIVTVPVDNAAAFADALLPILANPARYKQPPGTVPERYRMENCVEQMLRIYREAVIHKGP